MRLLVRPRRKEGECLGSLQFVSLFITFKEKYSKFFFDYQMYHNVSEQIYFNSQY